LRFHGLPGGLSGIVSSFDHGGIAGKGCLERCSGYFVPLFAGNAAFAFAVFLARYYIGSPYGYAKGNRQPNGHRAAYAEKLEGACDS
jgi:hypothetical protein